MLREITIKPALNGWIVRVGCQTLVFEHTDKMLAEMRRYLNDPEATEEEYRQYALNAKHTLDNIVETRENADPAWGEVAEEHQPEPPPRLRVHET